MSGDNTQPLYVRGMYHAFMDHMPLAIKPSEVLSLVCYTVLYCVVWLSLLCDLLLQLASHSCAGSSFLALAWRTASLST